MKERIRQKEKYERSDKKGLSGLALAWHLWHLEQALEQTTAAEEVTAPIWDRIKRRRLSRLSVIDDRIRAVGGIPPVPYDEYSGKMIGKLKEVAENKGETGEQATRYQKSIAAAETFIEDIESWAAELNMIESWIDEHRLPF